MKLINIGVLLILIFVIQGAEAAKVGSMELREGATITNSYVGDSHVQIYQALGGRINYAKSFEGDWVYLGTNILNPDLDVFNASRDYCHNNYPNGATIAVMNGNYTISTFQFTNSNLYLEIKNGVIINGSTTISDYPRKYYGFPSYTDNYVNTSMFWAQDVSNIGIIGSGIIDGNGDHTNFNTSAWGNRPYLIRFCNVTNFKVGGSDTGKLRLLNPAMWTQHYLNCSSGKIVDQYIRTCDRGWSTFRQNGNLDGVDVDCSDNIEISGLDIISQDDAICLKASGPKDCSNILITKNVVSSIQHSGIKTGTESNGGFVNIVISNNNIYDTATRGLDILTADGGNSKNILVTDINMENVGTPFFVALSIRNRSYGHGSATPTSGTMKQVTLQNINCWGPTSRYYPACITGYGPYSTGGIWQITVENFKVNGYPGGGTEAESTATIPELTTDYPAPDRIGTLPASGLFVRHVYQSRFRNIDIGPPLTTDQRPYAVFSDVGSSTLDGMVTAGGSTIARVYLNATNRMKITNVGASSGTLFRITNSATNRLTLIGNDCWGTLYSHGAEVDAGEIHSHHNPE